MPSDLPPQLAVAPVPTTLPSEELHEVISAPPAWLVQWGVSLFGLLLAGLLAGSWVVHYPDLVEVPLYLTTRNAPKPVTVRGDGNLIRLLAQEGSRVQPGQVLAYLESTANHAQVLALAAELDTLASAFQAGKPLHWAHDERFSPERLGELQPDYQTFDQAYTQYSAFQRAGFFLRKRRILAREIVDLAALNRNLMLQQEIYQQDLVLAREEFEVQQKLLAQGVIAPADIRPKHSQLLTKQLAVKQAESAIIRNYTAQTAKQRELLELDKLATEQESLFQQALNTLRSAIEGWQSRYVLRAPMTGRVFFSAILEEKQPLSKNQEVFYIDPESGVYYGETTIPQQHIGKVKVGQHVLVKLAGYPFQEFGTLTGQVAYISQIPVKENGFLAKITLSHGLVTTHGKTIVYRNGISATANIITEDSRLIEKMFYSLRRIWSQ